MPGTALVNDRVCFRTEGKQRVISVQGIVVAHYSIEDRAAEAYAMVMLFESGYADQNDIARCFGYSIRTLRRYHRHIESDGLAALARPKGRPLGSSCAFKEAHQRDRIILRLKAKGMSNRWIGGRLGLDEKQVRRSLRRLGWRPAPEPQLPFFPEADLKTESATVSADKSSGTSSSVAQQLSPNSTRPRPNKAEKSLHAAPLDRSTDRLLAAMGLLDDALPVFAPAPSLPRAGVLLAVPPLVASGLLSVAEKIYGSIGPAFYGLRTTLVAYVLLALLRIPRPEALKEHAPRELGRIVGLDRILEVKTLRRKLTRLASLKGSSPQGPPRPERGHRPRTLASRWDLRDIVVAYRMFERWRQENFFKYMRQEFLIDALVDYDADPDDPNRLIPNPARKIVDKELRNSRARYAKLQEKYGSTALDYLEG